MIKVIRATSDMAKQLVALAKIMGYDVDTKGICQRLTAISNNSDHVFYVAVDDDKVVGFVHAYVRLLMEVPEAIEVGGLAVADDYQGKGVGKLLIQAVEKWAREKNILWIALYSNILRVGAHGFYEHLDYQKIKQQFVFEKRLA
jgi:GNAT superfamily N-acetyltransferase